MKTLLIVFTTLTIAMGVCAQTYDSLQTKPFGGRHLLYTPVPPDTTDAARWEQKAFWRAAAETFGFNIGLWAYDRYIKKGHFAYISLNSIKENFKHGFEWDNDHLSTNMFAHPYNGSLFFNAGRANGYNFWQSELFAIGGSAMWELFMECEYPSTNDIIATPIGGAALGEVLYRASDLLLDDRSSGAERLGRELASFALSPMRGLTRVITGDAWKRRATTGRRFGLPPLSIELSVGARSLVFHDNDNLMKAGATARLFAEYGDPFAASSRTPYDYFSLLMELDVMPTQPVLSRIEIIGRLLSHPLIDTRRCDLSIGLYQHFDYFDSDTISSQPLTSNVQPCRIPYKVGTPASVGVGTLFRYTDAPRFTLDAHVHANGVILGGILSDFYRFYHRSYNWASGFSLKFGLHGSFLQERLTVSLEDQFYRLYSWNGWDMDKDWAQTPAGEPVDVQGDCSRGTFNHFEARVRCRLWKRLYATACVDLYKRQTLYHHYMEFPDEPYAASDPLIVSQQRSLRLMLSYCF